MRKKLLKLHPEQYIYHTGSNLMQTYKEIPPLAKDLDTGEIINLSTKPKIVEAEKEDIQARIQSFEEDQDIRNIIKRMEAGEKVETERQGSYEDISNLPNNYNDLIKYAEKLNKKLDALQKQQKKNATEKKIKQEGDQTNGESTITE